ncbi:MAG: aggregation factor core [Pseudomonadota bacterium]
MTIKPFLAAAFLALSQPVLPALADVQVTFIEGAPKDRFTITNTGSCALGPVDVTIDLSGSSAGLVFDVTEQGAGVEVFQPFELVSGSSLLSSTPSVRDGDNGLTLALTNLDQGQSVAFTIDVDDTIGAREITVSRAEISGAGIRVETDFAQASGIFDETAVAVAPFQACLS